MKDSTATDYLRDRVMDAGLCTNCGACVNLCPYYASYRDRAVVLDRCTIVDGACLDVCPRVPADLASLAGTLYDAADMTPELGAMKAFHITRATDIGTRKSAQHGGTITALVDFALGEGLIETAVLSGTADLFAPVGVTISEPGHAGQWGGSRLITTPSVATFNKVTEGDTSSVGVVATPCQALALSRMRVSRNNRIREKARKLRLVIGLFCGWALSSSALMKLLAGRVAADSILGMDIPPSRYRRLDVFTRSGTVSIPLEEVQTCVRESCHSCTDMTAEFSDISVGSSRLPEGWEEAKSWNQVIVRTEAGQQLLDMALARGVLESRNVPDGNLSRLKDASMNKKGRGEEKLRQHKI
jgi:coenzyme F420 hydrogenase subunit beta